MTIYNNFELLREQAAPELNTRARLFCHISTGAQLLSLENDDENKVFGINFRTPPPDSTGLPHIMEHAVLCGSEKYQVKEPFVELLKGSLKTFVNAFTYPDKTCYPVASQNLQDFYNLVDVYMDAVLHPLIPPHILQQEGWHFELDALNDPLTYKGVVFNEMKGAYSSPDDLLITRIQQALYPDNPYSFDCGGDPKVIPQLTYEQFKAFHEKYYHPSNAYIYFYGDDDPQERLRRMDGYLEEYRETKVNSGISLQPRFDRPRRKLVPYDPGEEAGSSKGMRVVGWMLTENEDPEIVLGLQVLNHILVGTPASPLRKALIESGLGEDLAGGGLEGDLRQVFFAIGLKGMRVGEDFTLLDGDKLESLVNTTLETLADQGIDPGQVAASLNTVEFRLRENNTGAFPRGLILMLRSLTTWLHGGDPLAPLAFEAPLSAIKARLETGEKLFEDLIRQHFLVNTHRVVMTLQPEPGLNQRSEAEEKERLARARGGMSRAELQAVVENTQRLKLIQETPDSPAALATIPRLKLTDLERSNKLIPLEVAGLAGCKTLVHDLFTNGIVYLDLGFDLHTLPQAILPFVPLFGRALLEMGTKTEDFVKLSQRIGQHTGGIRPASFTSLVKGTQSGAAWLFLRAKATMAKADELLTILRDVLLTARLDNQERFRQMVLEAKAEKEASLVPGGSAVVNTRLRALFNEADWAEEQMNGVEALFFLRRLAEQVDQEWPAVLEKLESLRRLLLNRQGMICNVTLDQANFRQFQPRLVDFLETLPLSPRPLTEWKPGYGSLFEGLTIPAQVNYVGKGANLFHLGYQAGGSISVITKYLRTTWLWEKVRIQGGAYGVQTLFDHHSGVFTFLSYRDPNLLGTIDNYDRAAQFLQQLDSTRLSQDELAKSIIGAIGDMDAYQLPDARGYTSMVRYLAGDTDEDRQLWREQILSANIQDFHAFGEVLERAQQEGLVVVLGSQEAIEAANAAGLEGRKDWLEVRKVL